MLGLVFLIGTLALVFPVTRVSAHSLVGTDNSSANATSGQKNQGQAAAGNNNSDTKESKGPLWEKVTWIDKIILVIVAFGFAYLKMVRDFDRYRGLLMGVLLTRWSSWVFVSFTALTIFFADYLICQWHYPHTLLQGAEMFHFGLILGHTGVTAAITKLFPILLSVIPSRSTSDETLPSKPAKKKAITEMNVVYEDIEEELDTRVSAKMTDWARQYNWQQIKSTGRRLLADLEDKLPAEEYREAVSDQRSFEECVDLLQSVDPKSLLENEDRKYQLLKKMLKHSSYRALSARLAKTAGAPQ